jgi:hypothetical protein
MYVTLARDVDCLEHLLDAPEFLVGGSRQRPSHLVHTLCHLPSVRLKTTGFLLKCEVESFRLSLASTDYSRSHLLMLPPMPAESIEKVPQRPWSLAGSR